MEKYQVAIAWNKLPADSVKGIKILQDFQKYPA